MTGAGIKLQTLRDALHQNNAEQGERRESKRFQIETCSSQGPTVGQTSVLRLSADVCLLAGVGAGFGWTEAAARGWMKERNLRHQKIVDDHTGEQHRGHSGENHRASGILEEREQQGGDMGKVQFRYQKFLIMFLKRQQDLCL